jgi:GTP cyclohydrolase I
MTKTDHDKILRIADSFQEIMTELGMDLRDDSLKDTPMRVAKMYYNEFCKTLTDDTKPKFTVFESPASELVLIRNIRVVSMCEHHFVPFTGVAHVGYLPKKKIAGLSKFNRIVEYFSRQPQLQERLTHQIGRYLLKELETPDVAVMLNCQHLCCAIRGVQDPGSSTVTSFLEGAFRGAEIRN